MRKTLLISTLIFGILIFLIGLRGIYTAYTHYDFYWTAKAQMPNSIIISKNGKVYDDSWKYFIVSSMVSIVGYSLMLVSNKRLSKSKSWFNSDFYPLIYIILILIPLYFTFFDAKYSFSEKMMQLDMEKRAKSFKK